MMPRSGRVALLEIGTNSTKLLVADVRGGDFFVRHLSRRTTRIGRGLEERGRIAPRAVAENIAVIEALKETISRQQCARVFAFSTFALRRAANAGGVSRRLERAIGVPLHVLSGKDEARFAYASARRNLPLTKPVTILADIGGGSTEVVAAAGGDVFCARSLALGALHLTERFLPHDPIRPGEISVLERHVDRTIRTALRAMGTDRFGPRKVDLVASGGAIGALSWVIASSRQGTRTARPPLPARVELGEATAFLDRCLSISLRERRRIRGLDPDRADIICAGLLIVVSMMRCLGKRVLRPNSGGVREGALLHLIQNSFRW